jgi:hypothetical protein
MTVETGQLVITHSSVALHVTRRGMKTLANNVVMCTIIYLIHHSMAPPRRRRRLPWLEVALRGRDLGIFRARKETPCLSFLITKQCFVGRTVRRYRRLDAFCVAIACKEPGRRPDVSSLFTDFSERFAINASKWLLTVVAGFVEISHWNSVRVYIAERKKEKTMQQPLRTTSIQRVLPDFSGADVSQVELFKEYLRAARHSTFGAFVGVRIFPFWHGPESSDLADIYLPPYAQNSSVLNTRINIYSLFQRPAGLTLAPTVYMNSQEQLYADTIWYEARRWGKAFCPLVGRNEAWTRHNYLSAIKPSWERVFGSEGPQRDPLSASVTLADFVASDVYNDRFAQLCLEVCLEVEILLMRFWLAPNIYSAFGLATSAERSFAGAVFPTHWRHQLQLYHQMRVAVGEPNQEGIARMNNMSMSSFGFHFEERYPRPTFPLPDPRSMREHMSGSFYRVRMAPTYRAQHLAPYLWALEHHRPADPLLNLLKFGLLRPVTDIAVSGSQGVAETLQITFGSEAGEWRTAPISAYMNSEFVRRQFCVFVGSFTYADLEQRFRSEDMREKIYHWIPFNSQLIHMNQTIRALVRDWWRFTELLVGAEALEEGEDPDDWVPLFAFPQPRGSSPESFIQHGIIDFVDRFYRGIDLLPPHH